MKRRTFTIFELLLGMQAFAMDAPMVDVGKKRPLPTEVEGIERAPAAKEGRVEEDKADNYLFSQFDEPTQAKIRSYLETGNGFGLEKLNSAAANMRNLRLVSKTDRDIIDDPKFVEKLIPFLAQKYTNNNRVKVALALHTKSAADWLNSALLKESHKISNPDARLLDKQVTNELIDQFKQGHVDAARFLLNASKVPNQNNYMLIFGYANASNRDTLLTAAAQAGDLPLFRTILTHSMPAINHVNGDGETALLVAISHENTPIALALLQAEASLVVRNQQNEIEDTALLRAAYKNNTQVVQQIAANPNVGEIINFANEQYPYDPIDYAVQHDNYPMFKMLLDVPGIRLDGDLLYGALGSNTQMVKDLVAKKINVNQEVTTETAIIDEDISPAVMGVFVVNEDGTPAVNDDDTRERLLQLLTHGLNVNSADKDGSTLLMNAAMQAKAKTVNALLQHGADLNIVDENGETALDYAQDLKTDNKDRIIKMLTAAAAKQGAQK